METHKIKTWRDPYAEGFSTTRRKEIELKKGLTVLVGCNGSGKTTLLRNIKEVCKKEEVPVVYYDSREDEKSFKGEASLNSRFDLIATSMASSEGENINIMLANLASKLGRFVHTGDSINKSDRLAKAFRTAAGIDDEEKKEIQSNKRFILMDAVDSGFSIDNIVDLKQYLFKTMIEDAEKNNIDLYIIISANSYELANGEQCFDVMEGQYITFKDYEAYKKFILRTAEKKRKRYEG